MECVNCKCPLGAEPKEFPFTPEDGEHWCPQCFCWKRMHMEPLRYFPGGFTAVQCCNGLCEAKTVAIGGLACSQCGGRNTLILPPKLEA